MATLPSPFSPHEKVRRITVYAVVAAVAWSALLLLSYWFQEAAIVRGVEQLAIAEARTAYEKDILYRRWASRHGGVYVPVTSGTPPNPNLAHLPIAVLTTRASTKHRDLAVELGANAYLTKPADEVELGRFLQEI